MSFITPHIVEIPWAKNLPEHWSVKKGKWEWRKESRPVREEDDIVTAFRDGEVTLRKNRREDGFTIATQEHGYQGIRKGDLVIHGMDAFAGAIGVSDSDGKSSPVYAACTPKNDCDPYYFAYLLKEMSRSGWIEALAKGIRERSTEFKFPMFSNLEYPIPPSSEQTAIANFLDKKTAEIKRFIELKEKTIELLKERKTAIINQAVTKGLDPNVEMKDSGIEWLGEIPAHWEVKKLKYLSKLFGRIGFRGYQTTDLVSEENGAITLSPSNMKEIGMDYSHCTYLSWEKYNESPEIQIQNGDVLMVKTGSTYGKVAYVGSLPKEATINPQILVFKEIEINSEFYHYAVLSRQVKEQVEIGVIGGTIPTISQTKIGNFQIALPDKTDQDEIVNYLNEFSDRINSLIKRVEKEITFIKEYQESLISEAVTGKIDVRKYVAEAN